jgi:hypothetical protein
VTVTADDGTITASGTSAAMTIQNTAPTAPVISIDPEEPMPGTDDLVCLIDTASSDDDGDALTYTFDWDVDGLAWTGSTYTTYEVGDTIDGADVGGEEEWACEVTPDDGDDSGASNSATATSSSLEISGWSYYYLVPPHSSYADNTYNSATGSGELNDNYEPTGWTSVPFVGWSYTTGQIVMELSSIDIAVSTVEVFLSNAQYGGIGAPSAINVSTKSSNGSFVFAASATPSIPTGTEEWVSIHLPTGTKASDVLIELVPSSEWIMLAEIRAYH